jgi:hypothetical protein
MQQLITQIKRWHAQDLAQHDPLVEGVWADQYSSEKQQDHIRQQYLARWDSILPQPTPASHPWLYDPCEPPQGWRYDPYYEIWTQQ